MSPDTLAVLAVGVALAGLQLALFRDLKGDMRDLRRETREDLGKVRQDLGELRRDLAAQGERLARIEGAVLGPARPEPPQPFDPDGGGETR